MQLVLTYHKCQVIGKKTTIEGCKSFHIHHMCKLPVKHEPRGAEYVSACQHCWQALFLFCQALFMRDPKWPKNDQKWPKNDQKWPKNDPKWQKWPKITPNGLEWSKNDPKWLKMAQKWHFWNVAIYAFCQAQIFCCQAPKTILHPWFQFTFAHNRPKSDISGTLGPIHYTGCFF